MRPPPIEVADIIRSAGNNFIDKNHGWLTWQHLKVLRAIERCRTAALGGHIDHCPRCGHHAISYNSCRNRHCPKCQTNARNKWLAERSEELLPVPYFHVVFTLPQELSDLGLQNKQVLYSLLFRASSETLLEVASDPKHLGADIGFLSVLHTWGQNLLHHPHVHCVIPAGGIASNRAAWISTGSRFFLPVKVLSRVFRGKFVAALKRAFRRGELDFHGKLGQFSDPKVFRRFLRQLFRQDWVVYAKRPFGGPEHVLHYLARYTHRVAISNHRLISFADGKVTFRWKDYAHGSKKRAMTVTEEEFLRRFLLHVLPRGFVRIRHFGFLANRRRSESVHLCRQLIGVAPPQSADASRPNPTAPTTWSCPLCAGPMTISERLSAQQIRRRRADLEAFADTS
ncbi:IS91 family transposase [Paludibaculum fermentans]|uniref:IS91 family transposase n=1 Tax=Paludibaculum fermentans TaxID=1473598 RepID=UPI003EB7162F